MTKLIATGTTFPARVATYHKVLQSLLRQVYMSFDKIIVNLDIESFGDQLPSWKDKFESLGNGVIEVNIVQRNTKTMKKVFPTVDIYPDDFIFSFDDDIVYTSTLLNDFYERAKLLDFKYSITCGEYYYGKGVEPVGRATLYMPGHLRDYRYYINEEDIAHNHDDMFIAVMSKAVHKRFYPWPFSIGKSLDYPSSGDWWQGGGFDYYCNRLLRMTEIAEVLEAQYPIVNEKGGVGTPAEVDEPPKWDGIW